MGQVLLADTQFLDGDAERLERLVESRVPVRRRRRPGERSLRRVSIREYIAVTGVGMLGFGSS